MPNSYCMLCIICYALYEVQGLTLNIPKLIIFSFSTTARGCSAENDTLEGSVILRALLLISLLLTRLLFEFVCLCACVCLSVCRCVCVLGLLPGSSDSTVWLDRKKMMEEQTSLRMTEHIMKSGAKNVLRNVLRNILPSESSSYSPLSLIENPCNKHKQ